MIGLIVARASRRLKWTTDGARVRGTRQRESISLGNALLVSFFLWFVSERVLNNCHICNDFRNRNHAFNVGLAYTARQS